MQAETISMVAGVLLSLLFSYCPGLSGWFAALGEEHQDGGTRKRLVMLGLLVLAALGSLALSCAGLPAPGAEVDCSRAGAWELARALAAAIVANQGVYALSPRPAARAGRAGKP
jgi:hypothetical protein